MKKFMDLLFEEEEVIEEETIEEPVIIKKPKPVKKTDEKIAVETPKVVRQTTKQNIQPPKNMEDILADIKPETHKISMDIDDLSGVIDKKIPAKVQRKPKPKNLDTYDFTPVISPIFGVDEQDKKLVMPTKPTKKVRPKDQNGVISPIFGYDLSETEDLEVNDIPEIKMQNESFDLPVEPKKQEPAEMVTLSLDEILAKTKAIASNRREFNQIDETTILENRNMSLFDDDSNEE